MQRVGLEQTRKLFTKRWTKLTHSLFNNFIKLSMITYHISIVLRKISFF